MLTRNVSIIHFDAYTDFVKMGVPDSSIGSGSWVGPVSRKSHVKKVVQFGLDKDLGWVADPPLPIGPLTHEMNLLTTGVVDCFPNKRNSTVLVGPMHNDNPTVQMVTKRLVKEAHWTTIGDLGVEKIVEIALQRVPTDDVYITIDKDVLREEDSVTNYCGRLQGGLTLVELVGALTAIRRQRNIVALDINGDGSFPSFGEWSLKDIFRRWKDYTLPEDFFDRPENVAINETSNLEIMKALWR